jgi:hypothetical protein
MIWLFFHFAARALLYWSRSIFRAAFLVHLPVFVVCSLGLACADIQAQPPEPIVFLPPGSIWSYLDNGSNQETAWREPGFDDTGWRTGPALLGYGDGDVITVVDCGPEPANECFGGTENKYITTYFRRTFMLVEPSRLENLEILLNYDDGAVVYLNGAEVVRLNLPEAPEAITYLTEALGAFPELLVPQSVANLTGEALTPLVTGQNTIAVEIHQDNPRSSDIRFDLALRGVVTPIPEPSTLAIMTLCAMVSAVYYGRRRRISVSGTARCSLAER